MSGLRLIKRPGAILIIILACILAFAIGVIGLARGQSTTFRVIGLATVVSGGNVFYLDDFNAPLGWHKMPDASHTLPPVPASSLVYLDSELAITDSGEGWGRPTGTWQDLGPIPGLVPTLHESWGQLKAKYAR
jgi:hypothetical protein